MLSILVYTELISLLLHIHQRLSKKYFILRVKITWTREQFAKISFLISERL